MEKKITVKDKQFVVSISGDELQNNVKRLASQINRDYQGKEILFVGVLNGVFMFAADLLKEITVPCTISFTKMSSYVGTTSSGKVNQLIGLNSDISGKDVIILEDIIDTGLTIKTLLGILRQQGAKTIKVATLIFKPESFSQDYGVDYVGFEIPNDFIVGYGLDYDGYGRNYPEIYKMVE